MFQSLLLTEILKSELKNNNLIVETTSWPPKCNKLIVLQYRFSKPYTLVNYRELEDGHYWFAEYIDGDECLACRFDVL
ncbi:hypothetical protein [Vibrio harveyi]